MASAGRRGHAQGHALNDRDTIAAVSSGYPPAAIAVIRVSGPEAMMAAGSLAGTLPPPRQAALRVLRADDGEPLDRAIVLVFPGPATATGEDLVELHCHGGRAVVEAVQAALVAIPGVRGAQPGEFTRRALANGRIDLIEAEGLADLLEAETEVQRRLALSATEGRVSRLIQGWFDRLTDLAARIEASIDFAEEGDVGAEAILMEGVVADQRALADEMADVLAAPPVERWRDGIRVVVAGPPNAGKSTLVNALSGRDAALVSPTAGTTRDRIEVSVRRGGIAYVLIDTAGLREESDDPVELLGIDRTREVLKDCDVILWLGDDDAPVGALCIYPKADLPGRRAGRADEISVSAFNGEGLDKVWNAIHSRSVMPMAGSAIVLGRRAKAACGIALSAIQAAPDDCILHAEQLRIARSSIASALGLDSTEAMLDALFGRFCLGK